ncbi:MAG: FAD-binding oxidoreductase [Candidatus Aminicenantes bacterium]|nr:FAD-binding oxidoreductase [Candidatus Aminicenantes bacterium]
MRGGFHYRRVDKALTDGLKEIVGRDNVLIDPDRLDAYSGDESPHREIARRPEAVVRPGTTEEVAAVLRLASEERVPVVPRGGGTGLSGGCVPQLGGLVLSLERMNRVFEIDAANQTAEVEAGLTLAGFNVAVEETGFSFPPHPGDEGAMIGGLIATNAGGCRALKYGGIRQHVRGLEVVLASGDVLRLGGKLVKSSTGYNLLHLFIGSEGTLGVITRATIQLLQPLRLTRTLVIPFEDIAPAIEAVPLILRESGLPMALEFVGRDVITATEAHLRKNWPCASGTTYLLVILDAPTEDELERLSLSAAEICLGSGALDVYVADTAAKQDRILEIRSKIYEAIKADTVTILDISLPRSEIAAHVKFVRDIARRHGLWLPTFGHAGDGNVHTHIMKSRFKDGRPRPMDGPAPAGLFDEIKREIYRDGKSRGGVISGEHGIGLVKKPLLAFSLDERQVEMMRGIKKVFDPRGILNPGKVFDP